MSPACTHGEPAQARACLRCQQERDDLRKLVRLGRMATYHGLVPQRRQRLVRAALR